MPRERSFGRHKRLLEEMFTGFRGSGGKNGPVEGRQKMPGRHFLPGKNYMMTSSACKAPAALMA